MTTYEIYEINREIALFCGWRQHPSGNRTNWQSPEGYIYPSPPNYVMDLNAMHESEILLTDKQQVDYVYELGENVAPITREEWCKVHASAMARAATFLKVIGKWKESETSQK